MLFSEQDEGQVVTVIGEAGIGRSRLMQRFQEEIAGMCCKFGGVGW